MINETKIVSALLKSFRGSISPSAFSAKLGYTSNQYSRWESGHSSFRWKDLIHLSEKLKIPIKKNMYDNLAYSGSAEEFISLVGFLLPSYSQKKMASICKVSPKSFSKWMSGASSPPVTMIFRLLSHTVLSAESFCRVFIADTHRHLSLSELFKKSSALRAEAAKSPWTIPILCKIETGAFDDIHWSAIPENVAKLTGIDERTLQLLLQELLAQQILRIENTRIYVSNHEHIDLTGMEPSLRDLIQFWNTYNLKAANGEKVGPGGPNRAGYLIFNTAAEDLQEVHEIFADTYQKLAAVSARNKRNAETYVFTSLMSIALTKKLSSI
ncbi:MAG: helix-turn-helix transcriptional regulator [Bdellovibrionota bacterium]